MLAVHLSVVLFMVRSGLTSDILTYDTICIQSGVRLVDIETTDLDAIKLSKKLEVCAKMVVGRESLSTEICIQCINKLRISYEFQAMCKKSTKILQGYLTELIGANSKINPEDFVNSDLHVALTPLNHSSCLHSKRKRITKEQRCSLLKQLLTPPTDKARKERDKYVNFNQLNCFSGGLRNIINFTKNYEFGDKPAEPTHLDKLQAFSNNFFRTDFSDYQNTILYIIENKDELDEDLFPEEVDENFNEVDIKDEPLDFEEVIVEPDIKVKKEEEFNSYEEEAEEHCKTELLDEDSNPHSSLSMPIEMERRFLYEDEPEPVENTMLLLDKLVDSYSPQKKTFSPNSVRCRTRNNPYISPTLKQQFMLRSFKCDKCQRYFKSPGYLSAHNSKVH